MSIRVAAVAGRAEDGQDAFPYPGRDRLQRRDQVGQEAGGVAIAGVEGQPRRRSPAARDPLADQGGLAEAGGRGDQGQPGAGGEAVVQPLHQSRSGGALEPQGWEVELGGEERRGHRSTVDPGRPGQGPLTLTLPGAGSVVLAGFYALEAQWPPIPCW